MRVPTSTHHQAHGAIHDATVRELKQYLVALCLQFKRHLTSAAPRKAQPTRRVNFGDLATHAVLFPEAFGALATWLRQFIVSPGERHRAA